MFNIHHDSGANRCVTNKLHLLHDVEDIQPFKIQGANAEEGHLQCTKRGIFKLLCTDSSTIDVLVYYTPQVDGTILSPSAIRLDSTNPYTIWSKTCDTSTSDGLLEFKSRNHHEAYINIKMINGLWYSSQDNIVDSQVKALDDTTAFINVITAEATYELWHQRMGHPGEKVMSKLHECVDGIANLLLHKRDGYIGTPRLSNIIMSCNVGLQTH